MLFHRRQIPTRRPCHVGGIPSRVRSAEFSCWFLCAWGVESARLGRSKPNDSQHGFVTTKTQEQAALLIATLNGKRLTVDQRGASNSWTARLQASWAKGSKTAADKSFGGPCAMGAHGLDAEGMPQEGRCTLFLPRVEQGGAHQLQMWIATHAQLAVQSWSFQSSVASCDRIWLVFATPEAASAAGHLFASSRIFWLWARDELRGGLSMPMRRRRRTFWWTLRHGNQGGSRASERCKQGRSKPATTSRSG